MARHPPESYETHHVTLHNTRVRKAQERLTHEKAVSIRRDACRFSYHDALSSAGAV